MRWHTAVVEIRAIHTREMNGVRDEGGYAVLCGGKHAGANRTSACDVLELGALAWRQPSLNLHAARSMIAAVTLGTKIFFAGDELAENRSAPAVAECSDMVSFNAARAPPCGSTRFYPILCLPPRRHTAFFSRLPGMTGWAHVLDKLPLLRGGGAG